ncbi:hypothetical protein L7F22_051801 [Adiantum nelumboides]|nr:hypothetical protein [Adiantum nelumboides]
MSKNLQEEERLIEFGTLDLQNDVASPDATWAIDFLARKLQEAMANPSLQGVVHTQLQKRHLTVLALEENSPSKSQHEPSKEVWRMEASIHDDQFSNIRPGNFNARIHNNNDKEEINHAENLYNHEKEERLRLSKRVLIQLKNKDNYKRFASEILGTAILMYFLCGVSMAPNGSVSLMDHAISAALGIMVIIFMFGTISGAHVNPAVTFGFACAQRLPWMQVPIYIVGQVLGAILGTVISQSLYSTRATIVLSIPYQGVPISFIAEVISAFLFMFLACSVASNAQVSGLYASIAVAAAIAMNIIVAGPLSGASMNPARSLAPAIVTGDFKDLWKGKTCLKRDAEDSAMVVFVDDIERIICYQTYHGEVVCEGMDEGPQLYPPYGAKFYMPDT